MGRPSKLTDKQWSEIEQRLLAGAKHADLAREYGVDRAGITRRFSHQLRNVKHVANQIVAADVALKSLPVAQQVQALTLADELRAISSNLASAAKNGSITALRLSSIAASQVGKVDSENPMESQEQLQAISALTKMANDSASLGMALLTANKAKDSASAASSKFEPPPIDIPSDPKALEGMYLRIAGGG